MHRVLAPLIRRLAQEGHLVSISYSLKGRIVSPEEDDQEAGAARDQRRDISPDTDFEQMLTEFDACRVIYHELHLTNGARLLLNRQLTWLDPAGDAYRIGPDLFSAVGNVEMLWAGELKGGADPAGSDEHWKTATQAFQRMRDAAAKTNRPTPMLSFIATILVERVAREAQAWINDGRLTSVYNLTKMHRQEAEMERFLQDMTGFLGFDVSAPGRSAP